MMGRPDHAIDGHVLIQRRRMPLPDGLAFEDAAALMVQGLTALHLARLSSPRGNRFGYGRSGRRWLAVDPAGESGMGRLAGRGRWFPGEAGPGAFAWCRRRGERQRPGLGRPHPPGDMGVHIANDFVGGSVTRGCLDALAPRGELVFGTLNRFGLTNAEVAGMFFENQSLRGFALLPLLTPAGLPADLAGLFGQATGGTLNVVQGGRYPL